MVKTKTLLWLGLGFSLGVAAGLVFWAPGRRRNAERQAWDEYVEFGPDADVRTYYPEPGNGHSEAGNGRSAEADSSPYEW